MAGSNIITRLLLDDSDYKKKLSGSAKQSESFAKTLTGSLTSSLTKVSGALKVAQAGVEAFEKIMNSSNVTADAFEAVMRSCNTAVGSFKTALVTADFTSFEMGLSAIMGKARETAAALDQLGNTTMSYGRFSAKNQADFSEAVVTMRDNDASSADKSAAKAKAEEIIKDQREITMAMRRDVEDAVKNLVTEGNRLGVGDVTTEDVDAVLRLDVSLNRDELKADLERRYKEYQGIVNEVVKKNTSSYTSQGVVSFTTWTEDKEATAKELEAVNAKYKDAILYNEILVRKGDDWLKEMINTQVVADNAERALAGMERTLNRASSSAGGMAKSMGNVALQARYAVGVMGPMASLSAGTGSKAVAQIPTLENGGKIVGGQYALQADEALAKAGLSQQAVSTGLQIIADEQVENIHAASDALNGMADIMGTLSGVVDESTASWMSWAASVLQAIAQAIPMIGALVTAEGAEATASGTASVGKSASAAAAGGPVAAIGAAVSVAAAVAAAMASIPKFALGGVVPGTSWTGDNMLIRVNSGERVVPRDQAGDMGGGARVEFVIKDRQLYGLLDNYDKLRGRRL